MKNPTEVFLYIRLDVSAKPPSVKSAHVGTLVKNIMDPGIAILASVDAGNLPESFKALALLIKHHAKYEWVRENGEIKQFVQEWSKP
jgi:hypothetical protein